MTQNIEIINIHLVIIEQDLTIRISLFSARTKGIKHWFIDLDWFKPYVRYPATLARLEIHDFVQNVPRSMLTL